MSKVFVFDPTVSDSQSKVRGVGRYLQLLQENFPRWSFIDNIKDNRLKIKNSVFINPFFNFLQPPLTLKRIAKKQIAVIHDLIPLKYPHHFPIGLRGKINFFLNKLALRNYDLIITDSEASKNDIINILKLPEKKIKVIYPCLPQSFLEFKIKNLDLNKNLKLKIPNSFCLYVGDATWNKNLVNLAKSIKIANITTVFVGRVFETKYQPLSHPWQKDLKVFFKMTKNDKRFIFPGFIDDYRLFKLYQQAKFNILISRDEGFGFSYLEAGNFSCPSIVSQIPIFKEITNNQGVIFADPNNPNDIADKMINLYFNSQLRDKLGFEAQQRSKYFNCQKFRDQFLKLIL